MNIPTLISNALRLNILGENAYRTRFAGFKAELFFYDFLKKRGTKHYKGGMFMPLESGADCTSDFIYYTVLSEADIIEEYEEIYKHINCLKPARLLVVKYFGGNVDSWGIQSFSGCHFPVPEMVIMEFINGSFQQVSKDYNFLLNRFQPSERQMKFREINTSLIAESTLNIEFAAIDNLVDIYVCRLIFDVILGLNIIKGVPADIDFIVRSKNGKLVFTELKEKDLAKSIRGFGLDRRRIAGMERIAAGTGIPYYLVVRHINNQSERIFINWRIIALQKFIRKMNRKSIQGGHGMRSSNSDNPTFICPQEFFSEMV